MSHWPWPCLNLFRMQSSWSGFSLIISNKNNICRKRHRKAHNWAQISLRICWKKEKPKESITLFRPQQKTKVNDFTGLWLLWVFKESSDHKSRFTLMTCFLPFLSAFLSLLWSLVMTTKTPKWPLAQNDTNPITENDSGAQWFCLRLSVLWTIIVRMRAHIHTPKNTVALYFQKGMQVLPNKTQKSNSSGHLELITETQIPTYNYMIYSH